MAHVLNEVVSSTPSSPLSEAPKSRVLLATAAIASAIFGGDLVLIGLVGLGIVALPFIWPVALGVLAGMVIVGVIAYAILHSSKAKMVEHDGMPENNERSDLNMDPISLDDGFGLPFDTEGEVPNLKKEDSLNDFEKIEKGDAPNRLAWIKERQEKFLANAKAAEERFRGDGWIDDNALKYFVLALSIYLSVSCNLKVSEDKPFDEVEYCQKLSNDRPNFFIRTVCIKPQEGLLKHAEWVGGMSSGNRVCLEPHASVFLSRDGKNWEYFDPKAIPLHNGLKEQIGKTSREVKSLVEGEIAEYRNLQGPPPQVQPHFNTVDCGIHVCRRIWQYFEGSENKYLPILTAEEMREVRENFADLIRTFVIDAFENPSNWEKLKAYPNDTEKRSHLFGFKDDIYDEIHTSFPSSALS